MKNYSKAYKDYVKFSEKEHIEYSSLVDWAFQYGINAIIFRDSEGISYEVSDDDYEYCNILDDLIKCIEELADLLFMMVEQILDGSDVFEEVYALKRTVQVIPKSKGEKKNLINGLFSQAEKTWDEVVENRNNFKDYREKCIDLCMYLLSTIYINERKDQEPD